MLLLGQTDSQWCVSFQFHIITAQCNIELFQGKWGSKALQFPLLTGRSYNPLDLRKYAITYLLPLVVINLQLLLFPTINLSQIQLITENFMLLSTSFLCPICYYRGMCGCGCGCGFIFRKWSYALSIFYILNSIWQFVAFPYI